MDKDHSWVSWNGNIVHRYEHVHRPRSEEELAAALENAGSVRVFGNKQSSADIAAGTETLIDLRDYNGLVEVDEARRRITVEAGMTLKTLIHHVEAQGWTFPCLPDIDTVTVGGALSTGTHGTAGGGHPLAESMVGARLVTADGKVQEMDESSELMPALRNALGTLGALSTVTFQLEPLYYLRVDEQAIRDEEWLAHFRSWLREYEFLRIIWLPHTGYGWVVRGERIGPDTAVEERGAPRFVRHRREVSKFLYKRTVRFPRFTRPANRLLRRLFFNHRTVKKGTLYGATVTKARGSSLELAEWSVTLDRFEELFLDLNGRPHWAKRFKAKAAELRPLYPRWDDFINLRRRMDPENKLLNPYLRQLLG